VPKKRIGIGRDQTPTPAGRKPQGALKKTTVKPRDTAEQSGNCGLRCRARLSGMARVPASTSGLGDELRGELFDAANGDPTSGIGRADDGGEIPHKPKRPAAAIALASICSAGRDRTGSPGSRKSAQSFLARAAAERRRGHSQFRGESDSHACFPSRVSMNQHYFGRIGHRATPS
jgi:hypothetical protein